MKQSLTGLFESVLWYVKRAGDPRGYAFAMGELHKHLKEVKRRHEEGESAEVLTEFFNLYVFED